MLTTINDTIERVMAGITASMFERIAGEIIFSINVDSFHRIVVMVPKAIDAMAPSFVALSQNNAATKLGVIAAP